MHHIGRRSPAKPLGSPEVGAGTTALGVGARRKQTLQRLAEAAVQASCGLRWGSEVPVPGLVSLADLYVPECITPWFGLQRKELSCIVIVNPFSWRTARRGSFQCFFRRQKLGEFIGMGWSRNGVATHGETLSEALHFKCR